MSPAYERTSGTALLMVQGYCRHLCGTSGFGTASQPTLTEVTQIGDQSYYKIAGELASAGYDIHITDQEALGWLERLQTLEMVIQIEQAYPVTGAGEPNGRYESFVAERDAMTMLIDTDTLETLGAVKLKGMGDALAITGISVSEVQSVRGEADWVRNRFTRDQFNNPGSNPGDSQVNVDRIG